METKVCKHCGRELPVDKFCKSTKAADRLQSWCKECSREYARQRDMAKAERAFRFENQKGQDPDNPLAQFTTRQLMAELFSRGYRGTLSYTKQIDISKL